MNKLSETWKKTGLLEGVCDQDQDTLSALLQVQLQYAFGEDASWNNENFSLLSIIKTAQGVAEKYAQDVSLPMVRRIYDILVNELGIEFSSHENVDNASWRTKTITVRNEASDKVLNGEYAEGEVDLHAIYSQCLVYDIVHSFFVHTGILAKNMKAIAIVTPISFSYDEDKMLCVNLTINYLPQPEL